MKCLKLKAMFKYAVDTANDNLKYELRDSKYEVIVRHTAVMTAATHARLCNTAPQAPDSELRTSYIVIRTFKLRLSVHVSHYAHACLKHKDRRAAPAPDRSCGKIRACHAEALADAGLSRRSFSGGGLRKING